MLEVAWISLGVEDVWFSGVSAMDSVAGHYTRLHLNLPAINILL